MKLCLHLRQIFTTLPLNTGLLVTRLWLTTAPWQGPGACPHVARLQRADEASQWLNLHFQQVVSDLAVSERSHILLSLIYKASLSCECTSDSSGGEKCGIHLALRSGQLVGAEEVCGSGYGGRRRRNNKKYNRELNGIWTPARKPEWKFFPNSVDFSHLSLILDLSGNI